MARLREPDPQRKVEAARAAAAASATGPLGAAELGLGQAHQPEAPRLTPRPAYLFLWHRERWQVLAGRVVPLLGQLVLQAGVGRVKQRKDGTFDVSEALAHKAKRGWNLVPLDVDGPGTSYLWRPTRGVVLTRWEQPHAGSSVVTTDVEAYAAWCASLVDRRVVPEPAPYVLEAMLAAYEAERLRLADMAIAHPSARPDLQRVSAVVDVIRAELARRAPPPLGPGDLEDAGPVTLDNLTAPQGAPEPA